MSLSIWFLRSNCPLDIIIFFIDIYLISPLFIVSIQTSYILCGPKLLFIESPISIMINFPPLTGSDGSAQAEEWLIPQSTKLKYTQLFNTHDLTRTGFISGPQARNILLQSGLPQKVLAQIWALADYDVDGRLTCEEFILANYLIERVQRGEQIPTVLPPELVPPAQRKPSVGSAYSPPNGLNEWAIPQATKLKYTQIFNTHDLTRTGFISGPQARNILLQSGLPQTVLAQIWALADQDVDGRLTCEEFILANYLIERVQRGEQIPTVLPPELVPPAQRKPSVGSAYSPSNGLNEWAIPQSTKLKYKIGRASCRERVSTVV